MLQVYYEDDNDDGDHMMMMTTLKMRIRMKMAIENSKTGQCATKS